MIILLILLLSWIIPGIRRAYNDAKKQHEIMAEDAITITANDLIQAYNDNEVAANEKYKDKRVNVTGTVISLRVGFDEEAYITLGGNKSLVNVQCYFENSDRIADLKKGTVVKVDGICTGKLSNINIEKSEIISQD